MYRIPGQFIEYFALLEASYTVARLVQLSPNIAMSDAETGIKVRSEGQNLTLVVSCADGCVVSMSH